MCKLHREAPPTKGKYFANIFAITSARNSKQASPQATGGIFLELVQTASAFALHYVCHITAACVLIGLSALTVLPHSVFLL